MDANNQRFQLGSETAKNGFKNENDIVEKFNNWIVDVDAQKWLKIMGYKLDDIDYVKAYKINGSFKSDVQVQVKVVIKLKSLLNHSNLQVKLVSNSIGYNQIDKRWVDRYKELWNIPEDVIQILKYYTGEYEPYIDDPRDPRRMHLDEFTDLEQNKVIDFFTSNKILVANDILKGRGQFAAEWILVAQKINQNARWVLTAINIAIL